MKTFAATLHAAVGLLVAAAACAQAPSFQVDQLYSNADGTIQFVVLHEKTGQNGQDHLAGVALHATGTGHDVAEGYGPDAVAMCSPL
jgi:hypothetical protein